MQLKINGEAVRFSLEKEKTLGEVMHGVQAWLGGAGFAITRILADGQDLSSVPAGIWGNTSVRSVQEIDVQALHTADIRVEHWQTLDVWLGMLAEEVRAPRRAGSSRSSSPTFPRRWTGCKANPFLPPGHRTRLTGSPDSLKDQDTSQIRRWSPEQREEAASLVADPPRRAFPADPRMPPGIPGGVVAAHDRPEGQGGEAPGGVNPPPDGEGQGRHGDVIGFIDTVQSAPVPRPVPPPERGARADDHGADAGPP